MKKIVSAVLGLSLTLAVAGISFAQTPAAQPPAKDSTTATVPAKKHVKKHKKASTTTSDKPAATTAIPSGK